MDTVATAEALHLFPCALCGRLDVAAGLMGADEVTTALGAGPLACNRVVLEAIKVGLGVFNIMVMVIGQRNKNGEAARREVGIVRGGSIHGAHVGKVVC